MAIAFIKVGALIPKTIVHGGMSYNWRMAEDVIGHFNLGAWWYRPWKGKGSLHYPLHMDVAVRLRLVPEGGIIYGKH